MQSIMVTPFMILLVGLTGIAAIGALSTKTIATNATHQGGYVELDVHNMFGLMEERTTHLALQNLFPERRPFLISRSTFASAGKWTGHWVSYILSDAIQLRRFNLSSSAITIVNGNTCTSASRGFFSSRSIRSPWSVQTLVAFVRVVFGSMWRALFTPCFSG